MRKPILIVALGLLSLAGTASADIPFFWLDKPTGRTNPNDPNSPNRPAPTATLVVVVGTNTYTPTWTNTVPAGSTNTFTPTITNTVPAGSTDTFTPTNTATYTFSNTFTNTNTFTHTFTQTPTPTPTATLPSGSHGSAVSNAESANVSDWCAPTAGTIYISKDGATTASPDPLVVTAGGSSLPGGSSANAFCYSGSIGNTSAAPYPYSVLVFDLVAGWTQGSAGVDISTYAPTNSITFSLKTNVPSETVKVDMPSMGIMDYSYFQYNITPVDTNWHQYTVYFPDGTGTPKFTTTGSGVWATEKLNVGQVRFQPVTTGNFNYDFCIDDVTFAAAPTPTPTATPTWTPTPTPTFTLGASCGLACPGCIKYEDFELAAMGPYTYQDTGSAVPVAVTTTAEYHTCGSSLQVDLATGTGNFAAVGFGSNFYAPDVINASGANYLRLWVKSANPITFKVSFSEFRAALDPMDEGWTSPAQTHTGGGTWQEFMINLASMGENIYNSACSGRPGGCLGTENNTIDLDKVGAMDINFTQTGFTGTVYVDDISFDPIAPTPTPTPSGAPVTFNDFEDGLACGSYTYADGGCTLSQAPDALAAYNSSLSGWRLTIDTTAGFVWGAGAGTGAAGCALGDATGKNNITFWIKADKTSGAATSVSYVISLKEMTVAVVWPASDPSNEGWDITAPAITTFGTWQKVTLALGSFAEKMGNSDCNPNCATAGDNVLGKAVISNFDFNITSAGFNGTVDIDDVKFE